MSSSYNAAMPVIAWYRSILRVSTGRGLPSVCCWGCATPCSVLMPRMCYGLAGVLHVISHAIWRILLC
eukprot:666595-Rhodomonas_salina.2